MKKKLILGIMASVMIFSQIKLFGGLADKFNAIIEQNKRAFTFIESSCDVGRIKDMLKAVDETQSTESVNLNLYGSTIDLLAGLYDVCRNQSSTELVNISTWCRETSMFLAKLMVHEVNRTHQCGRFCPLIIRQQTQEPWLLWFEFGFDETLIEIPSDLPDVPPYFVKEGIIFASAPNKGDVLADYLSKLKITKPKNEIPFNGGAE